ncbi:MAG: radical SAM protein [Deltaproteobacteria bacterium]|nr:radical SAM protein [Deltaproteobacteria bacterium]
MQRNDDAPNTFSGRPSLLGLRPDDLYAHLADIGVSARLDQCRRALAHLLSDGESDLYATRKPLAKSFVADVLAHTEAQRLEVVERVTDPADGFVKYLLRSPDGALTEAVRIPLHKEGRFTVCLSSQVGCAMQCVFCATGRLGLTRNLKAWEMVSAFLTVRDEAPGRVTGAVFMGQGEPLHNYDEVIRAAEVLSHPCGGRIRAESISISTVGLLPAIRRFTEEGHRFRLIVSLTSALAERRAELLPVAGRFPLEEVAQTLRDHAASRPGLLTVAWVLMAGVNTDQAEIDALRELLGDLPLRLNLIDVNDARADGFRPPSDAERARFLSGLQVLGVPIVRRYSGGKARHAACGMLASRALQEDASAG